MGYYKVLACKIFQRELSCVVPGCPNALDITFMRQDLHNSPKVLRDALQAEIDRIEAGTDPHTNTARFEDMQAILLAYGLCSNGIAGLKSSRLPLVVPRAHDCTTLFMGSKDRYAQYFEEVKGTFFYTQGWLDLGLRLGASDLERKRSEYMEKFDGDEDTVEYLLEMDRAMIQNYRYLTYISWPGMDNAAGMQHAREVAQNAGLSLLTYTGSERLMADLVNGNWNEEDFLVLQPGETLQPSFDERILCAAD